MKMKTPIRTRQNKAYSMESYCKSTNEGVISSKLGLSTASYTPPSTTMQFLMLQLYSLLTIGKTFNILINARHVVMRKTRHSYDLYEILSL